MTYVENINDAIEGGYITEETVTTAVSCWLNITFLLGQEDIPGPTWNDYGPEWVDSQYNRDLALSGAQHRIVLLQDNKVDSISNSNSINIGSSRSDKEPLLPLIIFNRDDDLSYAFIRPHFNSTRYMLSSYRSSNILVNNHSPYQIAMEQGINVQYSMGCNNITCTNKDGFNNAVTVTLTGSVAIDRVILFCFLCIVFRFRNRLMKKAQTIGREARTINIARV